MSIENYLKINVMPVHQTQTGLVFLGKISFEQLLIIHRLTERMENWLADPFAEQRRLDIKKNDEEFQRQLSPRKLNKIIEFLSRGLENYKKGESVDLFPTSIILAIAHNEEYDSATLEEQQLRGLYSKDLTSCFISSDKSNIFIPANEGIALIVDGQHRFYGAKKLYDSLPPGEDKEFLKKIEFIATFLVGFDIYELGKVFATVNFEQKPVNRSLYYDIFGSIPETERNDIKLAHDLALHLNNSELSPVQGMIKMLGKGQGLFSQAFFVENMLIHFKEKGVWEKIYTDYLLGGKEYRKIPVFMRSYLNSIKRVFNHAWPVPVVENGKNVYSVFHYDYVLCKTTGMGALFRLIKDIYPLLKEEADAQKMEERIVGILGQIKSEEARRIFSKGGDFGGAGSLGLQQKLYKFLKAKLPGLR